MTEADLEAINLNRLAYFVAVVDAGSFTRAAERLGITKTVVSQQVARLEADLRTSLLLRTTRRVEPTEAGRLLHARAVIILRDAEDAFGQVAEVTASPIGTLRVAAPNDFGTSMIAPLVATFCRTYPACTVDLVLSDARIDLITHHIDVSIRVGWLDDSSQQARRIGTFRQLLVAAPDFARTITAKVPEDLAPQPFIANGALREPLVLQFSRADVDRRTIRMRPAMTINTTPAVLAATIAGGGLSVLPDFLVGESLESGALVELLPDWSLPSGGIHVVYPAARFRPPKVTAFVDLLSAMVRADCA
jgi:DNA-binding transcriptional LysR family regulator